MQFLHVRRGEEEEFFNHCNVRYIDRASVEASGYRYIGIFQSIGVFQYVGVFQSIGYFNL